MGLLAAIGFAATASASSTDSFHSIQVVPVVVQTGTFSAEIYVFNPHPSTINVNFDYYPATGTPQATPIDCGDKAIPPNSTVGYTLSLLCPTVAAGSNFGMIEASDVDAANRPFNVFVRVNSPFGYGFAIESFPPHTFTGDQYWVTGLKRQASFPGYKTNCFFGALGEPTTLTYNLYAASGTQLGVSKQVVLAARQMVRINDIFADVGAPAGDHFSVRLGTLELGAGEPGAVVFCTVENSTYFDADFRIGKAFPAQDDHAWRTFSQSADALNVAFATGSGANSRTRHVVYFKHPDRVQCSVAGTPNSTGLEMRLVAPDGTPVAGAGGPGQTSFAEVYLGAKSTRNFGANGQWFIDVENATGGTAKPYELTCSSGSGHTPYEPVGRNLPDTM
jgi:hypothetical protein